MDVTRLPAQEPSVPVHVHPLTIFVIADHVTRSQYLHHLYGSAPGVRAAGVNPYSADAFVMGLLMGSTGSSGDGQRKRDATAATVVDVVGGYPFFYDEAVLREVDLEGGSSRVELHAVPAGRDSLLAAGAGLASAPPAPAAAEGGDDGGSDADPTALRSGPADPFFAAADSAGRDLRVSAQQLTRNYYVRHLDVANTTTQAGLLNRIYARTGVIGFYFVHRQEPTQRGSDLADVLYMIASFVAHFLLGWYPHLRAERMVALVMHTTAAPQEQRGPQMSLFECTVQAAADAEASGIAPPPPPSLEQACKRLEAEGSTVVPVQPLGAAELAPELLHIRKVKYMLEAEEMEHLCFSTLQDITAQNIHNNRPERGGAAAQQAAARASATQVIARRLREPVRAIELLRERLALLVSYLAAVRQRAQQADTAAGGALRGADHEILRAIGTICAQLPCAPPAYPHHSFNDCALLPPPPPPPLWTDTAAINVVGHETERHLLTELLSLQTAAAAELTKLVARQQATVRTFQHATQISKEKVEADAREHARRRERGGGIDLDTDTGFGSRARHGGSGFLGSHEKRSCAGKYAND